MNAVGYCRVSTAQQAEQGVSLEAQREKIAQKCAMEDWTLVTTETDAGRSGKTMKQRPALARALDLACEHKAVLVVYSLSRMSRSTRDTLAIIDRLAAAGAQFVSITEKFDTTTASGRLFFNICSALNNFERELTIERTNDSLDQKRENGEALGNTPYGFTKDGPKGKLIPDDSELQALRVILNAPDLGRYSDIARSLNAAGYPTRTTGRVIRGKLCSGRWDRSVVRRLIKFYRSAEGGELLERFGLDPLTGEPRGTINGAQVVPDGGPDDAQEPAQTDRVLSTPGPGTAAAAA